MKKGRKLNAENLKILSALLDAGYLSQDKIREIMARYTPDWNTRNFFWKLQNLQRTGYLERRRKQNQSFFHLTPRGKLQILKYLHLEKLKIKKWDGHWRVIIFDIPESLKKWREYLRPALKEIGFYPLQESVYITPYPVTGDLNDLLNEWNLRKYFRYLTVSEIDGVGELKIIFNLEKK